MQVLRRGHVRHPEAERTLKSTIGPPRAYAAGLLLMAAELRRAMAEVDSIILQSVHSRELDMMNSRLRWVEKAIEDIGQAWKGVFGATCAEHECANPQTPKGRLCIVHQTRRYSLAFTRRRRAREEAEERSAAREKSARRYGVEKRKVGKGNYSEILLTA